MSWWVYLVTDGQPVPVERHSEGGTRALGGVAEAEVNITYNYGSILRGAGVDLRGNVHGRTGADVAPLLRAAVASLGTEADPDYWKATPGNAGRAIALLLDWATQHPTAVFEVS